MLQVQYVFCLPVGRKICLVCLQQNADLFLCWLSCISLQELRTSCPHTESILLANLSFTDCNSVQRFKDCSDCSVHRLQWLFSFEGCTYNIPRCLSCCTVGTSECQGLSVGLSDIKPPASSRCLSGSFNFCFLPVLHQHISSYIVLALPAGFVWHPKHPQLPQHPQHPQHHQHPQHPQPHGLLLSFHCLTLHLSSDPYTGYHASHPLPFLGVSVFQSVNAPTFAAVACCCAGLWCSHCSVYLSGLV